MLLELFELDDAEIFVGICCLGFLKVDIPQDLTGSVKTDPALSFYTKSTGSRWVGWPLEADVSAGSVFNSYVRVFTVFSVIFSDDSNNFADGVIGCKYSIIGSNTSSSYIRYIPSYVCKAGSVCGSVAKLDKNSEMSKGAG